MTNFFSTDPKNGLKEHYGVCLKSDQTLPRDQRSTKWKADKALLESHGYKTERYYQFFSKDAGGKLLAERQANALADAIRRKCDIKMEVALGFFM